MDYKTARQEIEKFIKVFDAAKNIKEAVATADGAAAMLEDLNKTKTSLETDIEKLKIEKGRLAAEANELRVGIAHDTKAIKESMLSAAARRDEEIKTFRELAEKEQAELREQVRLIRVEKERAEKELAEIETKKAKLMSKMKALVEA